MREIKEKQRRVYEDFAKDLDSIKLDRIKLGTDKVKLISDVRLTRGIMKDPTCRNSWEIIKKRLSILPKEEEIK